MTDLNPTTPSSSRYLWATVGVLGTATVVMGAALVHMQSQREPSVQGEGVPTTSATVAAISAPAAVAAASASASAEPVVAPVVTEAPTPSAVVEPVAVATPKPAPAHAKHAQKAMKTVANYPPSVPAMVPPPPPPGAAIETPLDAPAPSKAPKVVCLHCGTVQSVTPVQREPEQGSGVGALAGAVLGGLVGNQFGGGDGKTAATIAGALGGGWAGNTVEKRMKKDTVYQVDVRMEDGSTRRLEQRNPIAVGTAVTVEGDVIHPQASGN